MSRKVPLWAIAVVLSASQFVAAQSCQGPGDLDGNTVVGKADFAIFRRCLSGVGTDSPPGGCESDEYTVADLDEDGDVDLRDFSFFCLAFGDEYFAYGRHRDDHEAERLAIELTGQLRAPDDEYERVHRDLQLIRAIFVELAQVRDRAAYVPREMLVRLVPGVSIERYTSLNGYYILEGEQIRPSYRKLTFCDTLNIPIVAREYDVLPEVEYAGPNRVIGGGDDITVTPFGLTYRYLFSHGYGDCPSGCICSVVWTVEVDRLGNVGPISCMDTCAGGCP